MAPKVVPNVDSLAEDLLSVDLKLQENRAAVDQLRKDWRQSSRRAAMPKQLKSMSKVILCRTNGDRDVLRSFVEVKAPLKSEFIPVWIDSLLSWYADASDIDKQTMAEPVEEVSLRNAQQTVSKWMSERCLQQWVQKQNLDLGIAPTTNVLMNKLPSLVLDGRSRTDQDLPRKLRSTIQYLKRWRKRWGLRSGKISGSDFVQPAVLKSKARSESPKQQSRAGF